MASQQLYEVPSGIRLREENQPEEEPPTPPKAQEEGKKPCDCRVPLYVSLLALVISIIQLILLLWKGVLP